MAKISVDPNFRHDLYQKTLKACGDDGDDDFFDYKAQHDFEGRVLNEWQEASTAAGKGPQVNKLVRFAVADGYAVYAIGKVGPRSCTLVHLPFGDGYRSPAVTASGSCPRSTVEMAVGFEEGMSTLFRKTDDENSRFFDSLAIGQIVHHASSDGWVRCRVIVDDYVWGQEKGHGKCLLAIAPVGVIRQYVNCRCEGDWFNHQLYHISPTGEIKHGFVVERIIEGKPFRCHATDIYEYTMKLRPGKSDPTKAPELPINPPPFTPDQLAKHQQWRDIETLKQILEQTVGDHCSVGKEPLDLMREVYVFAANSLGKALE